MAPGSPADELRAAFTAQAESFNAAAIANTADLLDQIVARMDPRANEHWLEAACGPGIITRRVAPLVSSVEGIDLTDAMVTLARREATRAGLANVSFTRGDATALDRPDASYDGAVTRFSVHHIPVPVRMLTEMARVVRPGGRIVVTDHVADPSADSAIWSQQIERLRDRSHWTCLTEAGLRALGEQAGLTLIEQTLTPYRLDFEDWLARGLAGDEELRLLDRALRDRPEGTRCFAVEGARGERVLTLQVWTGVWTRPAEHRIGR